MTSDHHILLERNSQPLHTKVQFLLVRPLVLSLRWNYVQDVRAFRFT